VINSVLSAGQTGLQEGVKRAEEAAQKIVGQANVGDSAAPLHSLSEAVVELKIAETQVVAAAAVVSSADETLGSLIDTFQ